MNFKTEKFGCTMRALRILAVASAALLVWAIPSFAQQAGKAAAGAQSYTA
jgi:hypothetical protein